MTTGEWITTLLTSNTLILGLATLITSIMIKSSELKAKVGNDNRDATIEKIKAEQESLEKEVFILKNDRQKLMDEVAEKRNALAATKTDISRLKNVVLSNSRKQRAYLNHIETQEREIVTLENSILSLAKKLNDVNNETRESILNVQSDLRIVSKSIRVVKMALERLKAEAAIKKEESETMKSSI